MNVQRIFIHPNFTETKSDENNVAIILVRKHTFILTYETFFPHCAQFFQMSGSFNVSEIIPKKLGKLSSNSSCNLYGWGGASRFPKRQSVEVFHPSYCDPMKPKMFCMSQRSINESTCEAYPGSPIICDESLFLAGFISQIDRKCREIEDKVILEFQSIGESIEWIKTISKGSNNNQITKILFLFSVSISILKFMV